MSKITVSVRLEQETIELLKIGAMQEGLRRGNYDLSYIDLIEEAVNEAYSNSLFPAAREIKNSHTPSKNIYYVDIAADKEEGEKFIGKLKEEFRKRKSKPASASES